MQWGRLRSEEGAVTTASDVKARLQCHVEFSEWTKMVRCEFVFAFSGSIIACSLAGNLSFEYWTLLLYHEGVGSKHSGYLA